MRSRLRRAHNGEPEELNITAFMNLMVVLVPFLLLTAVFSRSAILDLKLPSAVSGAPSQEPELQLELVLREDAVEVANRGEDAIKVIANTGTGYDVAALSTLLQQIKARYPARRDITLLLEPDIAYDRLVQVMDAVRVVDMVQGARVVQAELFPEIAIGDAPEQLAATSKTGR